nr:hypothetical protein [Tanacetum cinerariifolium]
MKKFTLLLILLSSVLRPLGAFAQAIIKGIVTDAAKGGGLPGVSIVVKGTTSGTSSNTDGSYTLQLPTPEATLIFSFVGFQTVERSTKGQTTLNVRLEDQKALDEVVVVGYGSVKRSDLTGSVATVKTDDLLKTIPTSINQGLQGQASLSTSRLSISCGLMYDSALVDWLLTPDEAAVDEGDVNGIPSITYSGSLPENELVPRMVRLMPAPGAP